MGTHVLNLYEIENVSELMTRYRLVDVEGPFGADQEDNDLAEKNLGTLAKQVAFQEKVPVALIRRGRSALLAVPACLKLTKLEYALVPDVVSLKPRQETHELNFGSLADEAALVALSFLRYHLSTPLMHNDSIWSAGPSAYFSKRPINYKVDHRDIDVYGGFGFHLLQFDGRLYLVLRLTYRYAETCWLIEGHDEGDIRSLKMRHLLYHFGNRWFPVQLLDLLGRGIRDTRFVPDNGEPPTNVYDYTLSKTTLNPPSWIRSLDPSSPAINYRYPGNEKRRHGAAALCKLLLSTEDPRVRALHKLSIKPPDDRFRLMSQLVQQQFADAEFDGVPIRINPQPLRVGSKAFAVPELRFGQGSVLRVDRGASPDSVFLRDLGKARMGRLLDPSAGLAVTSALDAQYMLAPQSLERPIVEDFQERLLKTVRQFTHAPYGMELVLFNDEAARTLKQQVDAIIAALDKAGIERGHALLILPDNAQEDLHNYIKRALHERVQMQCVSAPKLRELYSLAEGKNQETFLVPRDREPLYVSYLRYTALGLMIVNRQWPWVLECGTNYDAYVAVDVLHNTAAFTFFYDGGRRCFVRPHSSRQKEKLLRRQIRDIVYRHLCEDLKDCSSKPQSLIFRRDGKIYECEWLGFNDAVKQLIAEGVLLQSTLIGAVEVPKQSALGMRIVADRDGQLVNPTVGSWFALNDREGIVCTTGYPFHLRGTVRPLLVRLTHGNLNLRNVLEDVFWMSQLCWPVPDRCIRLPIDMKLCDDVLRSVAASADDDEAIYGEDLPEGEETKAPVSHPR